MSVAPARRSRLAPARRSRLAPARRSRLAPERRSRLVLVAGAGLVGLLAVTGCAEVPAPAAAPEAPATAPPVVAVAQSERVRGDVATRLQEARVAGDEALLAGAATGPAALLEGLRIRVDGPLPEAEAPRPVPAAVLVAPQGSGWPRWFATVTDPSTAVLEPDPAASGEPDPGASGEPDPAASGEPDPGASGEPDLGASAAAEEVEDAEGDQAVVAELPVLELYTADDVRLPYRLWARLTMLPGAELPAFPSAEVGAPPLVGAPTSVGAPTGAGAPESPSGEASAAAGASGPSPAATASAPPATPETPAPPETPATPGPSAAPGTSTEDAELLAAVTGLARRYASVMSDGDASPSAAEFEPDPFVAAVRARAAAEGQAVAAVADTTLAHGPLEGVEVLFAARAATGDLLAVTAVETTTTMRVRPGAGQLRPGTELRAAAGVEEVESVLTTRSVAALAFVVPAERGAIRLVAVGEGLVSADAG